MKNLVMVVHADSQQALADALRGLPEIHGFTFTHVEGHGPRSARDPRTSDRDLVVGYTPHVRVDVVLDDEDVKAVLGALRTAAPGLHGRCVYWVIPVDGHGRL